MFLGISYILGLIKLSTSMFSIFLSSCIVCQFRAFNKMCLMKDHFPPTYVKVCSSIDEIINLIYRITFLKKSWTNYFKFSNSYKASNIIYYFKQLTQNMSRHRMQDILLEQLVLLNENKIFILGSTVLYNVYILCFHILLC